jgi:hypothetical protein
VRERRDAEVHAVVGDVRVAAVEQRLDHALHALDVLGRARVRVGLDAAEGLPAVEVRLLPAPRERLERLAALDGVADRLVVHVRHVRDEAHLVAALLQPADHHVEEQERRPVPDVRVPVDRGPAGVDRHPRRVRRVELLHATRERVVEP